MRRILAALAVLASAGVASAATIQVKKGTDIDTIAEGVALAGPGDTVVVNKGVYFENVDLTGRNGIKLVGKGATWDGNVGGSDGYCISGTAGAVLVQGFRFRNGLGHVSMEGSGIVVQKCTFQGARIYAVEIGGDGSADNAVVAKNRFLSNAGAVQIYGDRVLVEKNTFRNLESNGIDLHGSFATFQKNALNTINTDSLFVEGPDARVLSNRFQNGDSQFVEVVGDRAVVQKNTMTETDSYGIEVTGGDALVSGNRITATYSNAIYVSGSGGTVLGNRITFCDSDAIYVSGNGNSVIDNVVALSFSDGIAVYGDGATVNYNAVLDCDNDGLAVSGGGFTILGNRIERSSDNNGIYISTSGSGSTMGGLVEDNAVQGTAEWGIAVYSGSVTLRGNTVTSCGGMDTGGILVSGSGNTLESNRVATAGGYGFRVDFGSADTGLADCVATDSVLDGFYLPGGSGFSLDGCVATGSGGEGLDNEATGTTVTGCTFLRNRIDVANRYDGGASFSGDIVLGNVFGTGGADTLPEVDFLP